MKSVAMSTSDVFADLIYYASNSFICGLNKRYANFANKIVANIGYLN